MHLKPSNIFYSQHQISSTFGKWNRHRNATIGETLDDLCNGRCKISDIETIKVVKKDGKWYTIDNRRLWVFHHLEAAGKCKEIPVEVLQYCSETHGHKFSTTNGGQSVTIIKGRSPGGTWHKRLYPVTPIKEREDKPAISACILNNQSNSEKYESPSADNVNGPLPDVLNTKGTVSQSCITKTLPITCVSGKVDSNRISRSPDIKTVTAKYRGISLSSDIAVANRDEWRKRMAHVWSRNSFPLQLLDSFKFKQLSTKYHRDNRYIPYNVPSKIAIQHVTRHLRYSQPFKERLEDKYSKYRKFVDFNEKDQVNVYSDSSDNDWQDDDIAVLADECKLSNDDKNEKGDSDDNKDSKEIDYDDDPWSDGTYDDDTSSDPEYNELDVWESNSDEYNVYNQFSDSESSDFVSDRESSDPEDAYAMENIENKEQLQEKVTVQTHGQSNYMFNDKHRFSTAQPVTSFTNRELDVNAASGASKVVHCTPESSKVLINHQTSASNSKLPGISPYGTTITTSNDSTRICLHALHPKTQSDICTAIPSVIPTLTCVEHSSDLGGSKLSVSACKTTESSFSIGCTTKADPNSSNCIEVPTCYDSPQSVRLMCISTFSETSSTNLTSQFSTTNSKSDSVNSVPVVPVSPTISSISLLDTTTTATPGPVAAHVDLPSVKSESIFEESSVDTDLSDTDDEDDEDSEDCYLPVYFTLDGVREIAIKKFGYDLFSSDSD